MIATKDSRFPGNLCGIPYLDRNGITFFIFPVRMWDSFSCKVPMSTIVFRLSEQRAHMLNYLFDFLFDKDLIQYCLTFYVQH